MTDIDFDELDKAVTSLMDKAVSNDPDDVIQEKNLNISSTLKPGEKPTYEKLDEVAKKIGNETLLTEGEQTVMGDVKPPTLDLSAVNTGVTPIAPLENIIDDPVTPVATAPSLFAAPAVKRPSSGRAMDVVRPSPTNRPMPTMPSLVAPDRLAASKESAAPGPIQEPEIAPNVSPESADTPRLTPFLPDMKVEKRPLGSSNDVPASTVTSDQVGTGVQSSSERVKDDASNDSTRENGAVENEKKDDPQKTLDASNIGSKLSPEEQKLHNLEATESEVNDQTAESVRAVESGDTEKLNNGSISQHYQVKATEPTEAAGAIYDVKDYHQALAHPKKQRSGWGTIVLIIIIIVACALIGAAMYFILGAGL